MWLSCGAELDAQERKRRKRRERKEREMIEADLEAALAVEPTTPLVDKNQ